MRTPLEFLEIADGHVGENLDDFRPCGARDVVAKLPRPHPARVAADGARESGGTSPVLDQIGDTRNHAATLLMVTRIVQPLVTRRNVPFGNVAAMDSSWTECREAHERVRWARMHAGYPTATAAAESMGMRANTYGAYERAPDSSKHTELDDQRASQFAKKFKVSWIWLLKGEGYPLAESMTEAQQRVVRAMEGKSEDDQARIAAAVEALLRAG